MSDKTRERQRVVDYFRRKFGKSFGKWDDRHAADTMPPSFRERTRS